MAQLNKTRENFEAVTVKKVGIFLYNKIDDKKMFIYCLLDKKKGWYYGRQSQRHEENCIYCLSRSPGVKRWSNKQADKEVKEQRGANRGS